MTTFSNERTITLTAKLWSIKGGGTFCSLEGACTPHEMVILAGSILTNAVLVIEKSLIDTGFHDLELAYGLRALRAADKAYNAEVKIQAVSHDMKRR